MPGTANDADLLLVSVEVIAVPLGLRPVVLLQPGLYAWMRNSLYVAGMPL